MRMFRTFCLFVMAASVTSCSDVMHVYVPSPVNSPMLREKNEVKVKLAENNLQAAYAITDNIGVIVNGHLVRRYKSDPEAIDNDVLFNTNYDNDIRGGGLEASLGYFKAFDKENLRVCPVFEVYAGYGRGAFSTTAPNYYEEPTPRFREDFKVRDKFDRIFVQPAIGISGKYIEGSFTSRFSLLRFREMNLSLRAFEGNTMATDFPRIQGKWMASYEPAITFGGGYKWFKGFVQIGYSLAISNRNHNDINYDTYMQRVFGSGGVAFTLGKWLKNKK